METTRQNKISRLLQKELSEIFLLQTKAMPGILISVSAVRISPDMSIARVYLSIFPSENKSALPSGHLYILMQSMHILSESECSL